MTLLQKNFANVKNDTLSILYSGTLSFFANMSMPISTIPILDLVTLGNSIRIGLFLFVSHCQRWPRLKSHCHATPTVAAIFANVNTALH
jgi:hypothetical protein